MVLDRKSDFVTSYSDTRVVVWKSPRTGLSVVLVKKKTPMVNGYFTVASEIDDDTGCPHTLEHLVFMGSEKYPYKGLLDTVGNQMLSNTNAWTDTDQTVYTLTSAGWDGFKTLLPVYLDHVLYPTLTDDACLTEVYHIDENAEEKGVVFSEIQGVENQADSLISLRVRQLMYGEKSPFSSETGGLMKALRVLTNEQIREFHKLRYKPDNLCVVVAGDVEPEELETVMTQFDDTIKDCPRSTHRPFVDTPVDKPPAEEIVEVVEFPEVDESVAETEIAFMGPDANDVIMSTAADILGNYLARDGVGKLNKELVETIDALAGDLFFYTCDFKCAQLNFFLSGIDADKADQILPKVKQVMQDQVANFDLEFVRDCLERSKARYVSQSELDPQSLIDLSITTAIYGDLETDLEKWAATLHEFDVLMEWTTEQWVEAFKRFYVDNKAVCVIGQPSAKLYDQLGKDKEARLAEYREKFGVDGLAKLGKRLTQANDNNNAPIPQSVLDEFISPDPSRIRFVDTDSAELGGDHATEAQKLVNADNTEGCCQLAMHFEHYKSQFVTAQVLLSTHVVDEELLPYLDVLFRELFAMPMVIDGVEMDHEQVVRLVEKDTLENHVLGGHNFEEVIVVNVRCKVENYATGVEWIHRAMYDSIFDKERVEVILDKHLSMLAEEKRDGSTVLSSSITKAHFQSRSFKMARDSIVTEKFYHDVMDQLDTDFAPIKANLNKARDQLFVPSNMRVLVHGDVSKLEHPVKAWSKFNKSVGSSGLMPLPRSHAVRTEQGEKLNHRATITPMPATESSYMALIGKIPTDYLHPDVPALALCCEYFSAVEGPLWKGIRGTGLAYGAMFQRTEELGQLILDVYRGADAGQSMEIAAKLVQDVADGTVQVDAASMEGAMSSIVNQLASREHNAKVAAGSKYVDNVLMQRGPNYVKNFMAELRLVTADQIRAACHKYVLPLFDPNTSTVFAACHPSMVNSLQTLFEKRGYTVVINEIVAEEEEEDDEGSEGSESEDDD